MSEVQIQDLATDGQVQVVDARVTQFEGAHYSYVVEVVTAARMNLQAELGG